MGLKEPPQTVVDLLATKAIYHHHKDVSPKTKQEVRKGTPLKIL